MTYFKKIIIQIYTIVYWDPAFITNIQLTLRVATNRPLKIILSNCKITEAL